MKQPLLRDILAIVMSSCMAVGLYWQETKIDVQEKRIQMLEDALLLKMKNQNAERPSRSLQEDCECPFTKNEDDDWVTKDADSLFIFEKGIVIGKKNTGENTAKCNYGSSILSVDSEGVNCPSGDGSVTFGYMNTASAGYSAVVGGYKNAVSGNAASGIASSISGGGFNTVSGHYSSISGGKNNVVYGDYSSISGGGVNVAAGEFASVSGGVRNAVNGEYSSISGGGINAVSGTGGSISGGARNEVKGDWGSILGGQDHVLGDSGTISKSNFENLTNATEIETIPTHHPEVRIAALEEHSPFNCSAEEGWCKSENKRFLFSEGVVVGVKNPACKYGTGTLSVDFKGTNCPSHSGSVTFGKNNKMSKLGSFTVR